TASARVGYVLYPTLPDTFSGNPPVGIGGSFPGSEVAAAVNRASYPSYVSEPSGAYAELADSSSFGRDFEWTDTFELQYEAGLGGYRFNLYAWTEALATYGGESAVNFANTITITAVTNTDGSAIVGGF